MKWIDPAGSPTADGSYEFPWDLQTALNNPADVRAAVQAATNAPVTLWLRRGVYSGDFTSYLQGSPTSSVVLRAAPGHRATINGSLTLSNSPDPTKAAHHGWYQGFEVTNGNRRSGVWTTGNNNRLVNLIVHGTGHPAIASWSDTAGPADTEIYGCLIWATRQGPPAAGSGIYAQNSNGTRLVSDTISFNNATTGMKAFAGGVGYADNFTLERNCCFNNGEYNFFAAARHHPMKNLVLRQNCAYRSPDFNLPSNPNKAYGLRTGYYHELTDYPFPVGKRPTYSESVTIQNNYLADSWLPLELENFNRLKVTGNTFGTYSRTMLGYEPIVNPPSPLAVEWDRNDYYLLGEAAASPFQIAHTIYDTAGKPTTTRQIYNLPQWRIATGFDGTSTFNGWRPPDKTFVFPNKYELGRANVVVYNWSNSPTQTVDLSGIGLEEWQPFWALDAQNYFGNPVAAGIFHAGTSQVELPMSSAVVAGDVSIPHTGPVFQAFVVVPERNT